MLYFTDKSYILEIQSKLNQSKLWHVIILHHGQDNTHYKLTGSTNRIKLEETVCKGSAAQRDLFIPALFWSEVQWLLWGNKED